MVRETYQGSGGLTPVLKKLLIRPQEEDEFMDTKRLLRETLNLTLAAMWNGFIDGNPNAEEFKLNLLDNALFRRYGMTNVDTMEELLKGLNIDDWEEKDFMVQLTPALIQKPRKRRGVLISNTLTMVETNHWSTGKDELVKANLWVDRFQLDGANVGELLLMDPLADKKHSVDAEVESLLIMDPMAAQKRDDDPIKTSMCQANKVEILTPKRKTISPPTQNQVARALKFQRVGDDGSPNLRIRKGMDTVPETPPGTGNLSSPALGRVKKQKRRKIATPKRVFTPDLKQTLITSVFSPREKVQVRADDDL